jgi:hypothetical protein
MGGLEDLVRSHPEILISEWELVKNFITNFMESQKDKIKTPFETLAPEGIRARQKT